MKKVSYLSIFIVSFFLFISNSFALDNTIKVYDDADLFTEEEEEKLQEYVQNYIEKYNMDMVIVTTVNNSATPKSYSENFYLDNGFGMGDYQDGILLLIDRTKNYSDGSSDVYIIAHGESMLIYDNERIEFLLDDIADAKYATPSGGNTYYSMAKGFIDSATKYAEKGTSPNMTNAYLDKNGTIQYKRAFPLFWFLVISLTISTVIVGILVCRNKMIKKATSASLYLDENTISYTRKEDRFINTHTTTKLIPRSDGGSYGGGSHGGGSHGGVSHGSSFSGGGRRI